MTIIGITGTDGKTTTSLFTAQLLEKLGYTVGLTCSQEHWFGAKKMKNVTKRTTPSPGYVKNFLKKCYEAGCTHVVIETSSHALQQSRVYGVQYDIGAVTNVTQEHGDYHPTMDQYADTKAKLFRMVQKSPKPRRLLIVNAKMNYRDLFANIAPEITTFFTVDHASFHLTIVPDDGKDIPEKMQLFLHLYAENNFALTKSVEDMTRLYAQDRTSGGDYVCLCVHNEKHVYVGLAVGRAAATTLHDEYFDIFFSKDIFLQKLHKLHAHISFDKIFHLYGMYLDTHIRGHNYGSKLLAEFETAARAKGYSHILIDVQHARENLVGRYKRHGFIPFMSYVSRDQEFVFMLKDLGTETHMHYVRNRSLQCYIQQETLTGSHFTFGFGKTFYDATLPVPGAYNVDNIAIAILVAQHCGAPLTKVAEHIQSIRPVAGRLQKVDVPTDFDVFLDFAVTPGALEAVLAHAKHVVKGHVWSIFGCTGGNHDHTKRPLMGAVAAQYADHIILTEDEHYGEDVSKIVPAIMAGMDRDKQRIKEHVRCIPDRKEAIVYAMQHAKKGDIVIITGMGDLPTRNSGGKEIDRSDADIVVNSVSG